MNLIPLGLDFETYYSQEYTLQKLTTSEYILDPRFEIIGVGLAVGGALPAWFSGDLAYIRKVLGHIPWERTKLIAHNAIFDGSILEWIVGYQPAKYFCTMMGSRPFVAPFTGRSSLDAVLKYMDLGIQKGDAVHAAMGFRRADFSAQHLRDYGDYCANDTIATARIHDRLITMLPEDEQTLIDLTIKKFTRPKLKLCAASLQTRIEAIDVEKQELHELIAKHGVDAAALRSRPKFAKILEAQGITIPKKKSKSDPEKDTFAFAKTDVAFMELLGSDNETVRELVTARLKLASNMEESRLARLLDISRLDFGGDSLLPVPLLYYGAHTGRFSGLDKINLQNLPRIKFFADGKPNPESGWLRRSIVAPDGYAIVAADLSNIEARIVATLAGQHDMIEGFRSGADLYSTFASRIYGKHINKKDHPDERFVGKTCILGLGYGMGWLKFLTQMAINVKTKGMTEKEAKRIVYLYRETYEQVPALWGFLETMVAKCVEKDCLHTWNCLDFVHERILLPNGMPIIYPSLTKKLTGMGVQLEYVNKRRDAESTGYLWGGAITENVVQALARIILTRAELVLAKHGLVAALQVHDELIYCVPRNYAEACKKAIAMAMCAPVDFMPNLPVACEIGIGQTYAECK